MTAPTGGSNNHNAAGVAFCVSRGTNEQGRVISGFFRDEQGRVYGGSLNLRDAVYGWVTTGGQTTWMFTIDGEPVPTRQQVGHRGTEHLVALDPNFDYVHLSQAGSIVRVTVYESQGASSHQVHPAEPVRTGGSLEPKWLSRLPEVVAEALKRFAEDGGPLGLEEIPPAKPGPLITAG